MGGTASRSAMISSMSGASSSAVAHTSSSVPLSVNARRRMHVTRVAGVMMLAGSTPWHETIIDTTSASAAT